MRTLARKTLLTTVAMATSAAAQTFPEAQTNGPQLDLRIGADGYVLQLPPEGAQSDRPIHSERLLVDDEVDDFIGEPDSATDGGVKRMSATRTSLPVSRNGLDPAAAAIPEAARLYDTSP